MYYVSQIVLLEQQQAHSSKERSKCVLTQKEKKIYNHFINSYMTLESDRHQDFIESVSITKL